MKVTIEPTEVMITRLPTGLVTVRARYTVHLANEAFTGPLAMGETPLADDLVMERALAFLEAVEAGLHTGAGLEERSNVPTGPGAPEPDWEL